MTDLLAWLFFHYIPMSPLGLFGLVATTVWSTHLSDRLRARRQGDRP